MNNEINYVSPFTRFCISIGNLPTAYLESMSYYESLTYLVNYLSNNVIPALNNNGEVVEEVQQKFTELQNYVDTYFDNLDVQQEINNKLDEMAEDGTLTTLIGNYVQPLIDEQNDNITNFENTVNSTLNNFDRRLTSVASGSPKAVSTVDDMTDTTKNYVLTTDGYWYYYNGATWVQGGLYQSSQVAHNSITYNNLDSELQEYLTSTTIPNNAQIYKNKYIDETGSILDVNNYSCYVIDVTPLNSYYININFHAGSYSNNSIGYAFAYNDTLIESFTKTQLTSTGELANNKIITTVEIPYNANKLLINTTVDSSVQDNYILNINGYHETNISKEQLDEKIQSYFNDVYTTQTPTLYYDGAIIDQHKTWQSVSGYSIYSLDVTPNTNYEITINQIYSNPIIFFGTQNYTNTKTIDGNNYNYQGLADVIVSETSNYEFTNYKFKTPAYCTKIYINNENGKTFTIKKSTSYEINIDEDNLQLIKNSINPLNEKTIMFTGDSICAASTEGVKGWPTIIQENNPTANVYNYGVDGATIAIDPDNLTKNVVTYIQTMYAEHPDADYIIIEGGANDYWSNDIELGTFNEHSNFNGETPYNTSTFSGALEWIFHYCLNNFDGKKVGYIVTQKINSGSNNFYQYMDRAKEICKKWSIPYIDLFNEGDLNYFITSQKQDYSLTNIIPTGDGCHPNLAGYKIITPKIENWLKYKI